MSNNALINLAAADPLVVQLLSGPAQETYEARVGNIVADLLRADSEQCAVAIDFVAKEIAFLRPAAMNGAKTTVLEDHIDTGAELWEVFTVPADQEETTTAAYIARMGTVDLTVTPPMGNDFVNAVAPSADAKISLTTLLERLQNAGCKFAVVFQNDPADLVAPHANFQRGSIYAGNEELGAGHPVRDTFFADASYDVSYTEGDVSGPSATVPKDTFGL